MRRVRAFSLVELMLTVVIVGILAAIAVPTWGAMVAKSRQTEAKIGLGTVHTLEAGHFAEHGKYGSLAGIGFVVDGGRYGYLISNESYQEPGGHDIDVGGSDGGGNANGRRRNPLRAQDPGFFSPSPEGDDDDDEPSGTGDGYAVGNPHYDANSFEVVAAGIISNSNTPNDLDIWSIDNLKSLENINVGY